MIIEDFHQIHKGETVLLVGNGPNLLSTPPEWFDYPSIASNTIYKYQGWKPSYYTAVDSRVMREFGKEIDEVYKDIPCFIPTPNLDKWQGENKVRFYHRPGPLWPREQPLWPRDFLKDPGITYGCIMHIQIQLAFFMGFTTMLFIGMEHKPDKIKSHFWGWDDKDKDTAPVDNWLEGHLILRQGMSNVTMINISQNTYVPEKILPRGDWQEWSNKHESKNA
jgi:hypothetical protein